MSAFVVDKTHIDALVTAGLSGPRRYGDMRWLWPELSAEDERDAYEAGQPWGPRAVELAQERTHFLTDETAGRVGAMLWAENRASVNHRYDEDEWEPPYEFKRLGGTVDPVIVLKAIACYEYQSCEHPDWERSEAHTFVRALEAKMIRSLPGYDDAPGWDITDRYVFPGSKPIHMIRAEREAS